VPDSGSPDVGGLRASVADLTTGQTGFVVASAANGFQNTSMADCSGTPFSFHAEYNTAKKANQVPWAALEGGVLMEQEIGHGESCSSVTHKFSFSVTYGDGSSYSDPNVFQTCKGGVEGKGKTGEGPCNPTTGICQHARTQGRHGPVACPSNKFNSGQLCEYSDANCFPKGNRTVMIDGSPATESARVAICYQNAFQNGTSTSTATATGRTGPTARATARRRSDTSGRSATAAGIRASSSRRIRPPRRGCATSSPARTAPPRRWALGSTRSGR
jgi:hypothetical protein